MQVHGTGGLQRQQAVRAFADLLSATEALMEAFLVGKSWVFITQLQFYTCGYFQPRSCSAVNVTRTWTYPRALHYSYQKTFFRFQVHVCEQPLHLLAGELSPRSFRQNRLPARTLEFARQSWPSLLTPPPPPPLSLSSQAWDPKLPWASRVEVQICCRALYVFWKGVHRVGT